MTRTEALIHLAAAIHQNPQNDESRPETRLTSYGIAAHAEELLDILDGVAGPLNFDPENQDPERLLKRDDPEPERTGHRLIIKNHSGVLVDMPIERVAEHNGYTLHGARIAIVADGEHE